MKWLKKILLLICVILFSPLIILGLCAAMIAYLVEWPKNKKAYTASAYFKDFQQPYRRDLLYSPEYRFYNSSKQKNKAIAYTKQASNGLEYFVLEGVLYLFPDFDQIDYDEEKAVWEVDYDGDWKPFDAAFDHLVSKIDAGTDASCVKLLVERKMFSRTDLNGVDIPECIFLTWSYERAFQNEESPLKLRIPTNATELFDMMQQTPELCGEYHISENGRIVWDLYESVQIEIGVDPEDSYIGVNKKVSGKVKSGITHWHPTLFELYDEVCSIGKRGNVLVIRSFLSGAGVLYIGERENCPYKDKKQRQGKLYYLEAQ